MVSDLPQLQNEGAQAATPRPLRTHAPGLLYYLRTRVTNGQAVFLVPANSDACLTALQATR